MCFIGHLPLTPYPAGGIALCWSPLHGATQRIPLLSRSSREPSVAGLATASRNPGPPWGWCQSTLAAEAALPCSGVIIILANAFSKVTRSTNFVKASAGLSWPRTLCTVRAPLRTWSRHPEVCDCEVSYLALAASAAHSYRSCIVSMVSQSQLEAQVVAQRV